MTGGKTGHRRLDLAVTRSAGGLARGFAEKISAVWFEREDAQRVADMAGRLVEVATAGGAPGVAEEPGGLLAYTRRLRDVIAVDVARIDGAALVSVSAPRVTPAQRAALAEIPGAQIGMEKGGPVFQVLIRPAKSAATPAPPTGSVAAPRADAGPEEWARWHASALRPSG